MKDLSKMSNEELVKLRDKLKNDVVRYNNLQWVKKVQLNSAYGAIGNVYFRMYDKDIAQAVTMSGQLVIRWIAKYLNAFMNKALETEGVDYVVFAHTDSVYICMDAIVKKGKMSKKEFKETSFFLDDICKKMFQNVIQKGFEKLAVMVNAYECRMHMKREAISVTGIWMAKNRYFLDVCDMEGKFMPDRDVKQVGLEAGKSSIPAMCRKAIKDAMAIILREKNEDLNQFIQKFRQAFFDAYPEDIAIPTGVSRVGYYMDDDSDVTFAEESDDSDELLAGAGKGNVSSSVKKRTPVHSRASIRYNDMVVSLGLEDQYDKIKDGEKIKYIYLAEPNPVGDKVIAFHQKLPDEFGLADYIDRKFMFERTFLNPIERMTQVVGWCTQHETGLAELLGV